MTSIQHTDLDESSALYVRIITSRNSYRTGNDFSAVSKESLCRHVRQNRRWQSLIGEWGGVANYSLWRDFVTVAPEPGDMKSRHKTHSKAG